MKPFDFANDQQLPSYIREKMQRIANARAAKGLISESGKTFKNGECKRLYDAGVSTHSDEYLTAAYGA